MFQGALFGPTRKVWKL